MRGIRKRKVTHEPRRRRAVGGGGGEGGGDERIRGRTAHISPTVNTKLYIDFHAGRERTIFVGIFFLGPVEGGGVGVGGGGRGCD